MASFRCYDNSNVIATLIMTNFHLSLKGAFLWDDLDQDQWSKITRIMVDQMNRWILVQIEFICGGNFSKCLGSWWRSLCSMILGGIDPEKLYRVKFIYQYDLCCCIVWASFRFECFGKTWATCENFLGKWFTAPAPHPGKKLPVRLWMLSKNYGERQRIVKKKVTKLFEIQ